MHNERATQWNFTESGIFCEDDDDGGDSDGDGDDHYTYWQQYQQYQL